MERDLEEYRRAHCLIYEKLAERLGLSTRRRALAWAIGENWPDAHKFQKIFDATNGEVTFKAMQRRRLSWLREKGKLATHQQLPVAAE